MKKILMTLGSIVAGVLLFGMPIAATAAFDGWLHEWSGGSDEGAPTLEICTDGIDNDADGLMDSMDSDCAPYYRILSVVKHVVGTSTPASSFAFTVAGAGVPSLGTFAFEADGENTFPNTLVGEYHITEVAAPGYSVSYDNCGTGLSGDNPLTIPENGVEETCTITNTWITTTPPGGEGTTTPPATTTPPTESTTTPATDSSGSDGDTGGSKSHRGSRTGGGSSSGSVLGASTCGPLVSGYLKQGSEGTAVVTLQDFLRSELKIELPSSGIFDDATEAAVNAFQLKYWEEVLAPWVKFGLTSDHTPTGYVYKTTLWKINQIFCESLAQEFPELP